MAKPLSSQLSPDNAELELKRAYNLAIETGVTHFWDRHAITGVHADLVFSLYKRAMAAFVEGTSTSRLAAERWARTVKHLSQAFWHEAKIDYLEPRTQALPFLPHARSEYRLHAETPETALALLDAAAQKLNTLWRSQETPEDLRRLEKRGRQHLAKITEKEQQNELLQAERIKAAHEYGRTLECAILAYEAEGAPKTKAA